jgi:hypothetical protein
MSPHLLLSRKFRRDGPYCSSHSRNITYSRWRQRIVDPLQLSATVQAELERIFPLSSDTPANPAPQRDARELGAQRSQRRNGPAANGALVGEIKPSADLMLGRRNRFAMEFVIKKTPRGMLWRWRFEIRQKALDSGISTATAAASHNKTSKNRDLQK